MAGINLICIEVGPHLGLPGHPLQAVALQALLLPPRFGLFRLPSIHRHLRYSW